MRTLKDQGRWSELTQLYKECLFFRTMVENSMQALAKSYLPLSEHIKNDPEFSEFWNWIYTEYQQTVALIKEVSGQTTLLQSNPVVQHSIQIREDIIMPLLTIQQYAMSKVNQDLPEEDKATYEKLIVRSLFGSINAGRNSV